MKNSIEKLRKNGTKTGKKTSRLLQWFMIDPALCNVLFNKHINGYYTSIEI